MTTVLANIPYYAQLTPTAQPTAPYSSTSNAWVFVTTSILSVVTTAGFLSAWQALGHKVTLNDFFMISYSGGGGLFTVASITNGVVTLVAAAS
jgi:hypothetical protein